MRVSAPSDPERIAGATPGGRAAAVLLAGGWVAAAAFLIGCNTGTYKNIKVSRPTSAVFTDTAADAAKTGDRYTAQAILNQTLQQEAAARPMARSAAPPPAAAFQAPAAPAPSNAPVIRGVGGVLQQAVPPKETPVFHGLMIAANQYDDPDIPDLSHPIADARRLSAVLERHYGFKKNNIVFLENPKRTDIFAGFESIRKKVKPTDSLLIFYAGHGKWREDLGQGYWLPRDAEIDNPANWISNDDIAAHIRGVQSRKTLVIADACFSGALFVPRSVEAFSETEFQQMYQSTSRIVMTSIDKGEVPDDSVYMKYLIKHLETNTKPFFSAMQLHSEMLNNVMANSPVRQEPQYGKIEGTGYNSGYFLFVRKTP